MNKAIPLLLIIPFLLLAGCQEQPKPEIRKPEPIAYELVCKADTNSAIAEAEAFDKKHGFKTGARYAECVKANGPPTRSYIFEADVLETKEGVVGETYQGCEPFSLFSLVGELVESTKELPMTVSLLYLTFEDTISDGSTKIIKVDRRTLKLDHYSEPRNMSCKLNDIFDDRAI